MSDRKIKFVSLFSGIGMQELGARSAFGARNLDIRAFCENHKRTVELYTAIHGVPADRNIGDITAPNEALINTLAEEDIDILTSSFPCQSFSALGKRKGFDDEARGGMLQATIDVVKRIKPKVIVLENVTGFLRHGGDEVARRLVTEIGYGFTSKVLNAAEYTQVPQVRRRWFAVCIRGDFARKIEYTWPTPNPCRKTVADVIARGPRSSLNPTQLKRMADAKANYAPTKSANGVVSVHRNGGSYERAHVRSIKGYAPTITCDSNNMLFYEVGLLTSLERLRLMGIPAWANKRVLNHVHSHSRICHITGNGIVVPLVARIFRGLRF